jgi:hypothetical protein
VGQQVHAAHANHCMAVGGRLIRHSGPYRYLWPSELDLMARLARFRLEYRWPGWHRSPFTADSTRHVTVYELAPKSGASLYGGCLFTERE